MIRFLKNTALVVSTDPILRSKCQEIPKNEFADCQTVGEMMFEVMKGRNGVGLAGPQIGIPYKIFVMNATKPVIVLNPEILNRSERKTIFEEGCLSLPGIKIEVERPKSVKVKFWEPSGKENILLYDGWTARVFQHEFDHLLGILIDIKKEQGI